MPSSRRVLETVLTAAGVLGPLAFAADWVVLGAIAPHYSPINQAISQLARVGASTRGPMTAGFVLYGGAIIAFGAFARAELPRAARVMLVGTGLATFGVAVFSLDAAGGSNAHAAFAIAHYVTLAAAPLLSAWAWRGADPSNATPERWWIRGSVVCGVISAGFLAASTFAPDHGLLQRIGLSVGDAWVLGSAVRGLRGVPTRI